MDLEVCEPPEKKERLDDDLEMVNYEMQIVVPVASDADIDPLLPVDTDQEPADRVQASNIPEFDRPIKSETTPEVRQYIYISSDEEIEEIITEPKKQGISREVSNTVASDCGPQIHQINRFQQAPKMQHASTPKAQVMTPPFDLLHKPDPAVNGVIPLTSNANQHLADFTNALQGQKHRESYLANLPSAVSINRPANAIPNAPPLVGVSKCPGAQQTPTNVLNALVQNQFKRQPSSRLFPPNKLRHVPMSVKRLLETPFMSDAWTNNQRNAIIKFSRPKPAIKLSSNNFPDLSAERFYNEIPWLCGSLYTKKFHCWPCLLFSYPSVSVESWFVWAFQVLTEGFNKLWKAHEASRGHQAAEYKLNMWLQSLNAPSLPNSKKEPAVRNSMSDSANLSLSDSIKRQTHLISNTEDLLEHSGAQQAAVLNALVQNQSKWQSYSSVAMPAAPSSHPPNNLLPMSICQPSSSAATPVLPSSHQDPQNNLPPMSNWQPYSPVATPVVPSSHQDSQNNLLPISIPMSVSRLVKTPLLSDGWTFEQKKAIIKSPRPQPVIELPHITLPGISAERLYSEIPWLCASSNLGEFFCWPCLLFFYKTDSNELWSVPKLKVLEEEFDQRRKAHEGSYAHKSAEKKLNIWLQSMGASPPVNPNTEPKVRNFSRLERVSRNRKLLSLLVQSVCHLRNRRHDVQMKEYAECFFHIVLSNGELRETLREFQGDLSTESAADFVFNHADPVEDAVGKFVESKISDEMKDARFVTLFMEDLSNIVEKSSIAVIVHFVDQKGDTQERIIRLYEVTYERSAGAIFTLFQSVVSKFGLRLKVAGFTYSATLVHPSEITSFNRRVERLCPVAKWFHYQRHNLVGMLFGTLSHLHRNCRNFFLRITEFQHFFKENFILLSSTFYHFEQFNSRSKLSHPKYDFDYGFITTLKQCYSSVLQTLGYMLARPKECPNRISSQGPIFMSFLQDIHTRFMITLISQLNSDTADVSEALQGKVDTKEWKLMIRRAIDVFIKVKKFGFEDIYLTALSPVLVKTQVRTSDSPKYLVTIFNEIMDTAIIFLHRRFDILDFGYVDLETDAECYYSRMKLNFEDKYKVRSQIVQYLEKEPTIRRKTLVEAVKHFHDHNLAAVVPEYAAFLDFAMTIPSSRSSLHCPAVDRILKCQSDRSRKPPKNLTWMEKELLNDIASQRKLCEAVIDILVTYQCIKEFSYKDIGGRVSLTAD